MEDCLFCKMSEGVIPTKIIYENDNFFSIFDINQEIVGHALVISKKHFETVLDMPASLGLELIDCVKKTSLGLLKDYEAHGFNLVNNNFEASGQEVKHFHVHILPRKKDDGVKVVG